MRITVLAENTSQCGLPVEHGLSLHIALADGRQLLFDMGQTALFAANAQALGVDLSQVSLAVLSHGHYDHGGGLAHFLRINAQAPVYVHHTAFRPHYSMRAEGLRFIGLDASLAQHPRVRLCPDLVSLPCGGTLFAMGAQTLTPCPANRLLYGPDGQSLDRFEHEQNLLLQADGCRVLFAGCAHAGIVPIVKRATALLGQPPTHVVGGMHLLKSGLSAAAEQTYIRRLATDLLQVPGTHYLTMHCTGTAQFQQLSAHMQHRISYLSCGEVAQLHASP